MRRIRALLAAWALVTLAILGGVLAADLNRAHVHLQQLSAELLQHVSDRALVSETAVEGFAAFVASLPRFDHDRARAYAGSLRSRYPFLYMFEVALRVTDAQRAATEQRLAARYPGFRIRQFGYADDRRWQTRETAPFYYPLVFQEPWQPGGADLIGLDIHASAMLKQAMTESFGQQGAVATVPFDLAEGVRGYVLHRAVDYLGGPPPDAFAAPKYALLALQADVLFDRLRQARRGIAVRLAHAGFADGDSRGILLDMPGSTVSVSAQRLLPLFTAVATLQLPSQPFVLTMAWQLGWQDLRPGLLGLIVVISLLLLWAVRVYAEQYIESELVELQGDGRLYELANFDSLTGLANRNRLVDFLETALARARRQRLQLAVLFIDLDGFKAVNDAHGHAIGDEVLDEVARRLSGHLRADELLARYGGDEFVWVTAGTAETPQLADLLARLRAEFARPFVPQRGALRVRLGVSIGQALYPADGRNIAALFEVADAAMYRDKRGASGTKAVGPPATGEEQAQDA